MSAETHDRDPLTPMINRRTLLRSAVDPRNIATVASVGAILGSHSHVDGHGHDEHDPHHEDGKHAEKHKETTAEIFEYLSSIGISTAFLVQIGLNLTGKRAFNASSAREMVSLGFLRTAVLDHLARKEGNHELMHVAEHEREEYVTACYLVPLLTALADIASNHVRVDANKIAPIQIQAALDERSGPSLSYRFIKRPNLTSIPETWEHYRMQIEADLANKSAQIGGIALGSAPLLTTYFASGFVEKEKPELMRMFIERYIASGAIKALKEKAGNGRNSGLTEGEFTTIQEEACESAERAMNGIMGYNRYALTFPCNINGGIGLIGDPPELFAMKDLADDPEMYLRICGQGTMYAAVLAMISERAFLGLHGQNPSASHEGLFLGSAFSAAANVAELGMGKITALSGMLGKNKQGERLAEMIDDIGDGRARDVQQMLRTVRAGRPAIEFLIGPYLGGKAKLFLNLFTGASDRLARLITEYEPSEFGDDPRANLERILHSFISGDEAVFAKAINKFGTQMETVMQFEGARDLSKIFEELCHMDEDALSKMEEIMRQQAVAQAAGETENDEEGPEPDDPETTPATASGEATEIADSLDGPEGEAFQRAIGGAAEVLGIDETKIGDPEHIAEVTEALRSADNATILRALEMFTKQPSNDGPGGTKIDAKGKAHAHIVSHAAEEVLFALLTQIPSVPSLVRQAKRILPNMVGLQPNERPSEKQLNSILQNTLIITMITSALADNVAAYMFARDVLFSFFEMRYLPEELWGTPEGRSTLFKEYPNVREYVSKAALKIAEFAGNLTKVGNGPNFLQNNVKATVNPSANPQGVSIEREPISMASTAVNPYAWFANLLLFTVMQKEGAEVIKEADKQYAIAA